MKATLNILIVIFWFMALYAASIKNIYGEVLSFSILIILVIFLVGFIIIKNLNNRDE